MSVSTNNEKPQPAVPKGSQRAGAEGWIRPAQRRNNKSFKIRLLLNPFSYADLGCALPAPTWKQTKGFLKATGCLILHTALMYISDIHCASLFQ